MCQRKCMYRTAWMECSYYAFNEHTRLGQIYKALGVDKLTPEVKELMRPKNCPFFTPGKRRRMPVKRLTVRTAPVEKRKRRTTFNEAVAQELYAAGASDRAIAEAVGVTTSAIWDWRKRNSLPTFYRSE